MLNYCRLVTHPYRLVIIAVYQEKVKRGGDQPIGGVVSNPDTSRMPCAKIGACWLVGWIGRLVAKHVVCIIEDRLGLGRPENALEGIGVAPDLIHIILILYNGRWKGGKMNSKLIVVDLKRRNGGRHGGRQV